MRDVSFNNKLYPTITMELPLFVISTFVPYQVVNNLYHTKCPMLIVLVINLLDPASLLALGAGTPESRWSILYISLK